MMVRDFEQRVLDLEGFRIVIRAPDRDEVLDHDFANRASDNMRVSGFYENRLTPYVGELEVVVLRGDGRSAPGNTLLRTLRRSYE
jgi:hypothetical protein